MFWTVLGAGLFIVLLAMVDLLETLPWPVRSAFMLAGIIAILALV